MAKSKQDILEYVMDHCTGGTINGTYAESYELLKAHAEKEGLDDSYFWDEVDLWDYEPFSDMCIGEFIKHIDNEVDNLTRFINS